MAFGASLQEISSLKEKIRLHLKDQILPFWLLETKDDQHGGFWGKLNRDGTAVPGEPKGLVQHARLVWSFSAFYENEALQSYAEIARWGRDFICKHFFDPRYGGYYYLLRHDTTPLEQNKYLYAQSFVIYALSRFSRVFGCPQSSEYALDLFDLIVRKAADRLYGGFYESFSRDWQRIHQHADFGIAGNKKTMNCHIHLMESLTDLAITTRNRQVIKTVQHLIDLVIEHIYIKEQSSLGVYFDLRWQPVNTVHSFGHDIETAWLLLKASETIGNYRQREIKKVALSLVEHTLRLGLDTQNCGLFYEIKNEDGRYQIDRKKVWWVQAEGLVGFLKVFSLTGDHRFYSAFQNVMNWVLDFQLDREFGEWHYEILPNGSVRGEKAGLWKTPYHNGRACLELLTILSEMAKGSQE